MIVYAAGITGGAHPAMSTFGQRWPNAQWHGSTPLTHNDSRPKLMMPVAIPDESGWLQCIGLREVTRKRWEGGRSAPGISVLPTYTVVHLPEFDPGMGAAVNPLGLN